MLVLLVLLTTVVVPKFEVVDVVMVVALLEVSQSKQEVAEGNPKDDSSDLSGAVDTPTIPDAVETLEAPTVFDDA